eukprot:119515-Rhodomonas_salina.2
MSGTEPASQYALSGTELAYQDELSGTELAYQEHNAIGPEGFSALSLALLSRSGTTPISCYAFATRCPVLRYAMMLCVVLLCCPAMVLRRAMLLSGTPSPSSSLTVLRLGSNEARYPPTRCPYCGCAIPSTDEVYAATRDEGVTAIAGCLASGTTLRNGLRC